MRLAAAIPEEDRAPPTAIGQSADRPFAISALTCTVRDRAAAELLGGLYPVVAIGEQELPCNIKDSDRWCLGKSIRASNK